MSKFDVSVCAIRRRRDRRRPFEVRWRAAARTRSRSFLTRALAESYRAELIRAARLGLEFDPATGEPVLWPARTGDRDVVSARGGVRGDEMAVPGGSLASQPGRGAGHRHPRANRARARAALSNSAAGRVVRVCLQPGPRRGRGRGDRAGPGLGREDVAAGHPVGAENLCHLATCTADRWLRGPAPASEDVG